MKLTDYIGGLFRHPELCMGGICSDRGCLIKWAFRDWPFYYGYVEIADYELDDEMESIKKSAAISIVLILLIHLYLLINPYSITFQLILFLTNILLILPIIGAIVHLLNKHSRKGLLEWHATEHMMAEFIERYFLNISSRSFDNFIKCPPLNICCGTVYVTLSLSFIISIYATVISTALKFEINITNYYLVISLLFLCYNITTIIIYNRVLYGKINLKNYKFLIVLIMFPLVVERLFMLRKPDRLKLEMAYEESLKIIKQIEEEYAFLTGKSLDPNRQ